MEKLIETFYRDNKAHFVFTRLAVDLLRANIKGVQPEVDVMYAYSSANINNYVHYLHNNAYKVSARLTNKRLLECISFCEEIKAKEKVKEEQANIKECKPTLEQIVQDLKYNLSEDDQHKLANMIASNVGYVLCAETQAIDNIAAVSYINNLNDPSIMTSVLSDTNLKLYEPVPEINSGGACDYYRVGVTHPTSKDQVSYVAECNDIIESLELTYAEANMFKEIWRTAAERTLGLKKAGNTNKRAAEKMVFFADRYYQQNVHQANITDSRKVTK